MYLSFYKVHIYDRFDIWYNISESVTALMGSRHEKF